MIALNQELLVNVIVLDTDANMEVHHKMNVNQGETKIEISYNLWMLVSLLVTKRATDGVSYYYT